MYAEAGRPSIPPERLLRATYYKYCLLSARSANYANGLTTISCFVGLWVSVWMIAFGILYF